MTCDTNTPVAVHRNSSFSLFFALFDVVIVTPPTDMAPNSPPPLGTQVVSQPTLAPSPTLATGTISRSIPTHTLPRRSTAARPPTAPSSTRPPPTRRAETALPAHALTSAEAYANAHYPVTRRDYKENVGGNKATKPLFEWISRKLGAGRRGPIGDASGSQHNTAPARLHATSRTRIPPMIIEPSRELSPKQIFAPAALTREASMTISRSESHSLRSYSLSYANSVERERRREANNPYPSIPVPPPYRASTIDSTSVSYLSRSRTSSDVSIRPRISLADDSSLRWTGADEDASIRAFLPSHPASPTPSQSIVSRSGSASLLSPSQHAHLPASPSSHRLRLQRSVSSSTNSSDGDRQGRQSRHDSTSTKPTTILSFDSGPHMAHIAQAPSSPGPSQPAHQSPHSSSPLRNSDRDSPEQAITPPGVRNIQATPTSPTSPLGPSPALPSPPSLSLVQAPKHTQPHPRDNPRPSSPPDPNASTLTLASSTFAVPSQPLTPGTGTIPTFIPGPAAARLRDLSVSSLPPLRPTSLATSPGVTFAAEANRPPSTAEYAPSTHALSLYGGAPSLSVRTGGWHGGRTGVADGDASVRAVRRKGSWESNQSEWSWRAAQGQEPYMPGVGDGLINRNSVLSPLDGEGGDEGVSPSQTVNPIRESLMTRDSYKTARSRLSSHDQTGEEDDGGDTTGLGDKRYQFDKMDMGITA